MSAEIVKINPDTPEKSLVSYVADRIRSGHVLGMPTDTFYGLAADPYNLRAVELIYIVKSRLKHKPLSLLVESVDQAEELADISSNDNFNILAEKYWPGPLTIIVKAAARLPHRPGRQLQFRLDGSPEQCQSAAALRRLPARSVRQHWELR